MMEIINEHLRRVFNEISLANSLAVWAQTQNPAPRPRQALANIVGALGRADAELEKLIIDIFTIGKNQAAADAQSEIELICRDCALRGE